VALTPSSDSAYRLFSRLVEEDLQALDRVLAQQHEQADADHDRDGQGQQR
jgi:hypothetical protein